MDLVIETTERLGYLIVGCQLYDGEREVRSLVRLKVKPGHPHEPEMEFDLRYHRTWFVIHPVSDDALMEHARSEICYFLEGDRGLFIRMGDAFFCRDLR